MWGEWKGDPGEANISSVWPRTAVFLDENDATSFAEDYWNITFFRTEITFILFKYFLAFACRAQNIDCVRLISVKLYPLLTGFEAPP